MYYIIPIRDIRQLQLLWPLPSVYADYASKPHRLISHTLGHESAGSILSLLKDKQLANGLSSGLHTSGRDVCHICVFIYICVCMRVCVCVYIYV